MKFISYPKVINSTIVILMFLLGCNKQSEPLQYNDPIWTKDIDGYSRDMHIHNDTLIVVNEDEGLLIYKLEMDTLTNTLTFDSLYFASPYYQNKEWNLSGILFSNKFSDSIKRIIILDGFYCTLYADLSVVLGTSLEEHLPNLFQNLQCAAPNHHSSRFTINNGDQIDIFTLVRKVSSYSTSDISSIYQSKWIDDFGFETFGTPVIDSLNYDLSDVHYMKDKLVISHTNDTIPEFQIYSIKKGSYSITKPTVDTLTLIKKIEPPARPNTLYSTGDILFMGMGDHAGINIYNLENMDNVETYREFATGFSVREIFWDPLSNRLLLSCGYQGVVVLELDGNMQEVDSWILTTSYAYAARSYRGNIIVATRKGLEIITLNINQ